MERRAFVRSGEIEKQDFARLSSVADNAGCSSLLMAAESPAFRTIRLSEFAASSHCRVSAKVEDYAYAQEDGGDLRIVRAIRLTSG